MSSEFIAKATHSGKNDVQVAFRLGWSLSEFLGRARRAKPPKQGSNSQSYLPKELRGFNNDEAPRLTYSNRYFSRKGAWWQAALRVTSYASALNLLEEENEQTQEIQALSQCIYALTYGEDGKFERETPRHFYNLLEPWSREVGVKLATRSDHLALAFKVGGQIADTYWFMRGKERYGDPRDERQDSWQQLLNHKRLINIIDDIKRIEEDLPPLVGPCLRFSLFRWMVSHDLEYQEGKLILVRNEKYKDQDVEREYDGILKQIELDDEREIVRQLNRQAKIWQTLVLGTRKPESYLNRRDKYWIFWESLGRYLLIISVSMLVLTITGGLLIILLGGVTSSILTGLLNIIVPAKMQPETIDKSLSILTNVLPFVSGSIVFFASLVRDIWIQARGLWRKIYDAVQEKRCKEKTWVPIGLSSRWYRFKYWRKED